MIRLGGQKGCPQTTISSALSNFAAQHPAIGGIAASLAWFYAGQQSFSDGSSDAAIAWQCVAVMIILLAGGWAVVMGEWLGLTLAAGVLYIEVRSIRRILITQRQRQ
jgi:hypothetical protein